MDQSSAASSTTPETKSLEELLPPELKEIAENMSPDARSELTAVIQASSHQGWLPPPSILAEYEQVVPGLAERIVRMPEREQEHRHRVVEKVASDDVSLKKRGQNFAMISLVLLLFLAGALLLVGDTAWAARVAILGIVGVVGIFVTGRWADTKIAKIQSDEDQ